jgi:hypothetical protein
MLTTHLHLPLHAFAEWAGHNCNITRPHGLSEKKLNTQALNTEVIKQQTKRKNCIPQEVK